MSMFDRMRMVRLFDPLDKGCCSRPHNFESWSSTTIYSSQKDFCINCTSTQQCLSLPYQDLPWLAVAIWITAFIMASSFCWVSGSASSSRTCSCGTVWGRLSKSTASTWRWTLIQSVARRPIFVAIIVDWKRRAMKRWVYRNWRRWRVCKDYTHFYISFTSFWFLELWSTIRVCRSEWRCQFNPGLHDGICQFRHVGCILLCSGWSEGTMLDGEGRRTSSPRAVFGP